MIMKKNLIMTIAIVMALGMLSGCAEPKTPEQLVTQSVDKKMTQALVRSGALPSQERLKTSASDYEMIAFERTISKVSHGKKNAINRYLSSYRSERDAIARLYTRTAKSRGNIVKLYHRSINQDIINIVMNSSPSTVDNLDSALIEFDKKGNIVSVLVRRHNFSALHKPSLVMHDRASIILLGNMAQDVQHALRQERLKNNFITTL